MAFPASGDKGGGGRLGGVLRRAATRAAPTDRGVKERGGVPALVFTGAGSARESANGGGREVRGCLKTGSHKGCPYG